MIIVFIQNCDLGLELPDSHGSHRGLVVELGNLSR